MKTILPIKLYNELIAAGIPVDGCSSDGRIDFKPEATLEQRQQATAILAAHDPTPSLAERREMEYLKQGVTDHALIDALWEKLIENKPDLADALQAVREKVKNDVVDLVP